MMKGSSVALALLVSYSLFISAQESKIGRLTGNANSGKVLYRRYCITCHGVHGDGAGENAPHLEPKPRDFTRAAFKCRSTPSGSLPTDSDLYNTISRGIYNTGMPSWEPLTRQQRADLVAYIKTFSTRFHEEPPVTSVPILLELSREGREGKRSVRAHADRQQRLCDSALRLDQGNPLQVWRDSSRFVQRLGHGVGWHPNASICGCSQT